MIKIIVKTPFNYIELNSRQFDDKIRFLRVDEEYPPERVSKIKGHNTIEDAFKFSLEWSKNFADSGSGRFIKVSKGSQVQTFASK